MNSVLVLHFSGSSMGHFAISCRSIVIIPLSGDGVKGNLQYNRNDSQFYGQSWALR